MKSLANEIKKNSDLVFLVGCALRNSYGRVDIIGHGRYLVSGRVVVLVVGREIMLYSQANNRRKSLVAKMDFVDYEHFYKFAWWLRCEINKLSKKRIAKK